MPLIFGIVRFETVILPSQHLKKLDCYRLPIRSNVLLILSRSWHAWSLFPADKQCDMILPQSCQITLELRLGNDRLRTVTVFLFNYTVHWKIITLCRKLTSIKVQDLMVRKDMKNEIDFFMQTNPTEQSAFTVNIMPSMIGHFWINAFPM